MKYFFKHIFYVVCTAMCLLPLASFAQKNEVEELKPLNMNEVRAKIGYPAEAQRQRIQGDVVVRVLVDTTGRVMRHVVIQEVHPSLLKAVESHIDSLRFSPAMQGGKPIVFWVNVLFPFSLYKEPVWYNSTLGARSGVSVIDTAFLNALEPKPTAKNVAEVRQVMHCAAATVNADSVDTVFVRVLVGADGSYKKHLPMYPVLMATKKLIKKHTSALQFEPAIVDGQPVAGWVTVGFPFETKKVAAEYKKRRTRTNLIIIGSLVGSTAILYILPALLL